MAAKVEKKSIPRKPGHIYYLDSKNNILELRLETENARPKKVGTALIWREVGFLYYIDNDGDIARVCINDIPL